MKFSALMFLSLFTFAAGAQSMFSPANPADAPKGMTYDVKQPPVEDRLEFEGKRVAILAAHGVQETELTFPFAYLRNRGAQVDIVSPEWSKGEVLGVSYLKPTIWIRSFQNFKQAQANEYDLVILTGGSWNSNVVRKDQEAIKLIKKNAAAGKIIAAICSGSQILIDAGLARGSRVTGTGSIAQDLKNAGAKFVDTAVVTDGNLVTGRGPAEVLEFMKAIHEQLLR